MHSFLTALVCFMSEGVVYEQGGGYNPFVLYDWLKLWRSLTYSVHHWLLGNVTFVLSFGSTNYRAPLAQLIQIIHGSCAAGLHAPTTGK